MTATETIVTKTIQQTIIEKMASLSLEKQQQVLAFANEMTRPESGSSKFRAMFEEAAKEVPPEAWDEIPSDASSNIDRHLNQRLER